MIALIIILTLLCVLAFILLLPISLSISYENDVRVTLSVLMLRIPLYPRKKKIRLSDYSKKRLRKRRKKQRIKQEAAERKAKKKKKGGTKQTLRTVRLLFYILKNTKKRLLSTFRVRICRLYAAVGTPDAAKTAVLYGLVSQTFCYILEVLERFTKTTVSTENVTVFADFCAEKTDLRIDIRLTTNLLRVLGLAIKATAGFLTFNKTEKAKNQNGGIQNERKQSE